MKVNGREVYFLKTVGAVCDIEEHCPEQNMKNISALFNTKTFRETVKAYAVIICALSKGYEDAKHFEDANYVPNPVTEEELFCISEDDLMVLFTEATRTFYAMDQTVEAEEPKGRKKKTNETSD